MFGSVSWSNILILPEEWKHETSSSNKHQIKVFGFHPVVKYSFNIKENLQYEYVLSE